MSSIIQQLSEFIDTAERNRKYPQGTASGRRAALRLFEPELNEQEKESLDILKKNLQQIYQTVFNKHKSSMNAESLDTYRKRLQTLIKDYETYGQDPTKLANWNRPLKKITKGTRKRALSQKVDFSGDDQLSEKVSDFSRFELPLRPGSKAIIVVPSTITKEEVNKLRSYIDFLESIAVNEAGEKSNTEEKPSST